MSKSIYFIGDLHLDHKGILNFCRSHYSTVEDMNEGMIDLWNMDVKKKDITWVLGDVAFSPESLKLLDRMNGEKRLIMGNHDIYPIQEYAKYFSQIYGAYHYKEFILTHVPVHTQNLEFRWQYNIHGHIHAPEQYSFDNRYINVNADAINCIPMSLEEIRTKIKLSTYTKNNTANALDGYPTGVSGLADEL